MKKTPDKLSRDLQDQVQIALLSNVVQSLKKNKFRSGRR